jgi:hypothetical protein
MGSRRDSKKSNGPSLEIRATEADTRALDRAARMASRLTPAEYLRLLSQFTFSYKSLRSRKGPHGEPFKL